MKKLKLEIELEYDDYIYHNGDNDQQAKDWFYNTILLGEGEPLFLHSNEISDTLGEVKVTKINEIQLTK